MSPGSSRLEALLVGGLAGGLAYAGQWPLLSIATLASGNPADWTSLISGSAIALVSFTMFASPVFAIGMVGIGWPVWLALDRLGIKSGWAAALTGALGAGGAAQCLASAGFGFQTTTFPWLVFPGAVAGWVAHREFNGPAKASFLLPDHHPREEAVTSLWRRSPGDRPE